MGRADRRQKQRLKRKGGGDGAPSGDGGDGAAPAEAAPEAQGPAESQWKPVAMGMDTMTEFEMEGGCMFEEAAEDFCISYSDGRKEVVTGSRPQQPRAEKAQKAGKEKQKKKERRKADTAQPDAEQPGSDAARPGAAARRAKKRKTSGAGAAKAEPVAAAAAEEAAAEEVEEAAAPLPPVEEEELPDMTEWARFELHPELLRGLGRLGFIRPTAVQARCLEPALRQRKDIVGAAETGSGKTLAFGLPILHHTLFAEASKDRPVRKEGQKYTVREGGVAGLVILPTRELAVQVQSHINAVAQHTELRAQCVVGGISTQKQQRLLRRRPHVVVATPGRLFALLGLGKKAAEDRCEWLQNGVKDLRHLVLDEADRLVESGHFRELDGILAHIYGLLDRSQQLQTFVFSATLTLDPRSSWQRRKVGDDEHGGKLAALMERVQFREARAVHTVDLTVPEEAAKNSASIQAAAAARAAAEAERGVAPAPEVTREAEAPVRNNRLPERLSLREAICKSDKDKEAVLAMWLLRRYRWHPFAGGPAAATAHALMVGQRADTQAAMKATLGGRVVLFVNAISSVRRLSSVLALLMESPGADNVLSRVRMGGGNAKSPGIQVEVLGLHSQMRQKERLKKMERFRKVPHAVLVCTDIAARGLDVPDIKAVLHYQPPRVAEIFVHRSGRTARAGRSGESVAVVGPGDAAQWMKIYRATGVGRELVSHVDVDSFQLTAATEAIRLAVDLEAKMHKLHWQSGEKTWLKRTAEEAELMLSDDEQDADDGKDAAPRRKLWGEYQQLLARMRRPPRRHGASPLSRIERHKRRRQ